MTASRRSLAAVLAATLAIACGSARAQPGPAAPPSLSVQPESYSPRVSNATVPMRVEVLTATSFVDVESRQLYRLYGIDACDLNQKATLGKQTWPCGIVATAWLVGATLNKWVACTPIRQGDGATVARCASSEIPDLAAEMVKLGYAVTLPAPEDRLIAAYPQLEKDARAAYRGLWASSFQMPWIFRQKPPQ